MSASARSTRPSNKSAHPGAIVAPRTRRSSKQVKIDRDAIELAISYADAVRGKKIESIALLEDRMHVDNQQRQAHAANPPQTTIKKSARPVKNLDIIMSGRLQSKLIII